MFTRSTQKMRWMYTDETEINNRREEANKKYTALHQSKNEDPDINRLLLSAEEEHYLTRHYELQLRDFCRRFNPAMPAAVTATAFHYFKRFYLNNSVMDYHPKEILVTCVFLACKVEEFNVSMSQFVANIKGDREKATDIILNNELLLMQQLDYQLTVHNPYRPIEGILIDIKTRSRLTNPEQLREAINELLDKLFLTNACLLYSPAQLALAAVLHAVSKLHQNLDAYVTNTLLGPESPVRLADLIEAVRKIRSLVKSIEPPKRDVVKHLERRLEKCRNQENNPDSTIYKERVKELLDDEEERAYSKYAKVVARQAEEEAVLLGATRVLSPPA